MKGLPKKEMHAAEPGGSGEFSAAEEREQWRSINFARSPVGICSGIPIIWLRGLISNWQKRCGAEKELNPIWGIFFRGFEKIMSFKFCWEDPLCVYHFSLSTCCQSNLMRLLRIPCWTIWLVRPSCTSGWGLGQARSPNWAWACHSHSD